MDTRDELAAIRNEIDGDGYRKTLCETSISEGPHLPNRYKWCPSSTPRTIEDNLSAVDGWLVSHAGVSQMAVHDHFGYWVSWTEAQRGTDSALYSMAVHSDPDRDIAESRAAIAAYRKLKGES